SGGVFGPTASAFFAGPDRSERSACPAQCSQSCVELTAGPNDASQSAEQSAAAGRDSEPEFGRASRPGEAVEPCIAPGAGSGPRHVESALGARFPPIVEFAE